LGPNPELKVYLSNAPEETAKTELIRIVGMRWPIETAIEESKGDLGMGAQLVGMASSHDPVPPGPPLPDADAASSKKKAPALTFQQARLLLASVLPLKRLTPEEAIRRIRFIQRQNHAAYVSHRKRTLNELDDL
jgi:hypothetical protein